MSGLKVGIVGAGRLATLLATRLPTNCRKVVIGSRKSQAASLADEVGGIASDHFGAVRGCPVVFIAIPGEPAMQAFEEIVEHLDSDALLVNMVSELPTGEVIAALDHRRICAAKLIGQAREISLGSPGLVVLDYVEEHEEELLRSLLSGLGCIIRADESLVGSVTEIVARSVVQVDLALRQQLSEIGLERIAHDSVITTLAPGMLRSLSDPTAAPFFKEAIRKANAPQAGVSQSLPPH
jgi:pyrroline-5-carboxylate reductase